MSEIYKERAARDDARIDELMQRNKHLYDLAEMLKRQRNTAELELDTWKVRAKTVEEQREAARDEADRWKGKWAVMEEDREGWKERALKSEQGRQVNRDLLVIAEGQRDQAKADAEHWKGEWAVVMGQLGGARAEVEAVKQRAEAAEATIAEYVEREGACCPEDVGFDEYIAALTQQAEAAEAERDVLAEKWGGMVDDNGDPLDASGILEYVCTLREELSHMQDERDALRKDAARLREAIDIFISFQGSTREPEGQAALDAALAVQPTTSTEIHA